MVRYFDLIEDDDVVVELLSFLDFRAAVRAGRTCKRLKRASDGALDAWVAESLARVSAEVEKDTVASGCDDNGFGSAQCGLSLGWSAEYRTKAALIETALEHCAPSGISQMAQDNYTEDRARFLLRTRGRVDLEDFLPPYSAEIDDEIECATHIKFKEAMPFAEAVGRMHDNLRKLHDVDDDDDLVEEEDVFRVQHHTLCLLRKADRSSIRYSHLNSRRHQVDAATGTTQTRILFQLPEHDDAKVEFWYSISFTNY